MWYYFNPLDVIIRQNKCMYHIRNKVIDVLFKTAAYSMEISPFWEVDSRLTNQEIPCLLGEPKVHYHVHKSPPLDYILSQRWN
jgi:hypothetical protein